MHNRIRELRKALNINQTNFANQIGMTQTALSMIEIGKSALTDKNIKLISSMFNVNETWIRNGTGDIFKASPYEKEFSEIFKKLQPESQKFLLSTAKGLLNIQNKLLGTPKEDS